MEPTGKSIEGWDGKYIINEKGVVINTLTGNVIKHSIKDGTPFVQLIRRDENYGLIHSQISVAKLVLSTFSGKVENSLVLFIDRDRMNVSLDNLMWIPKSEKNKKYIQLSLF